MSSSGDRCGIGVEAHVRLIRTGTDARYYEGSLSRVAELVIAACPQHDLDACSLSRPLAVPAGVELCGAGQHHEDVILLGMGVQRVFSDAGGVTMDL